MKTTTTPRLLAAGIPHIVSWRRSAQLTARWFCPTRFLRRLASRGRQGLRLGVAGLLCLATFAPTGCATAPKSPAAARIAQARKDYTEATSVRSLNTYLQGVLIGAGGGAAVGAGIGAAAGDAGTGAAIGAVVGTFIGIAVADHVVDRRKKFADASAHLQACSLAAEKQIAASRDFNQTLESELGNVRAEDRSLSVALTESKDVLQHMQRDLDGQRKALESALKENPPEADITRQRTQVAALEREITRLTAHVERLTQEQQRVLLGTTTAR